MRFGSKMVDIWWIAGKHQRRGLVARLTRHLAQRVRAVRLWWKMVMTEDLAPALAAVILLGHIDHNLGIIVRLELATLDILDPSIGDDLVDADTAVGIRVEHLQQNASQGRRVDADIESVAVGIVRLRNDSVFFFLVLLVPLIPARH